MMRELPRVMHERAPPWQEQYLQNYANNFILDRLVAPLRSIVADAPKIAWSSQYSVAIDIHFTQLLLPGIPAPGPRAGSPKVDEERRARIINRNTLPFGQGA
jgi:hypothetical protein